MDQVNHSLACWPCGGYDEVIRNTGWNLAKARRKVRRAIKSYGCNPIGYAAYEELLRQIADGELIDNDPR